MNALTLAIASIKSRPIHALLCTVAVSAGIALLCSVLLFSQTVASGFSRNAQGIDIVVGTKGSPLQLVLSSVYHADIPAGNITMDDLETLKHNPRIRKAIPLALGDNYHGYRMVGTTPDYLALYNAEFAEGKIFDAPFETVAGANTGLTIGETIAVSHGFSADSDDVHDNHLYTITGLLKPTGTVLDKLLLTQVESVQQLHAGHHHHHHEVVDDEEHEHVDHDHEGHEHADHEHEEYEHEGHEHAEHEHEEHHHHHDGGDKEEEAELAHQITSVLLKLRSPIDVMNMPRQINQSSNMMAAVPSYEMVRFVKSLGIGRQLIVVLGTGFVILSALMLWATLSSGLALRRYDLAVLRVLGASPRRLCMTVIAEACLISGVGACLGVVFGHIIAYCAVQSIESLQGLVLPETILELGTVDIWFVLLGIASGLLASLWPSITAAKTDITYLLTHGRG